MDLRFAEDFKAGDIFELGRYELTQEEIIEFSKKYNVIGYDVDYSEAEFYNPNNPFYTS